MFSIFGIGIWEITIISKYEYNELVLATEFDAYNFIFFSSAINIITSLYLLWTMINKYYDNLNLFVIFVIKLCICVWSILLYIKIKLYGDFNNVIMAQFILSLTEISIIILLFIIFLGIYFYNSNEPYISEHIIFTNYVLL